MSKSTSSTVENRVNAVYREIMKGSERSDIIQNFSKWSVTSRTIDNYIRSAKKRYEKLIEGKQTYLLGLSLSRLNDLYKQAYLDQDWRCCLMIIKETVDLVKSAGLDQEISVVDFDYEIIEE